jgi:hypothetical protein
MPISASIPDRPPLMEGADVDVVRTLYGFMEVPQPIPVFLEDELLTPLFIARFDFVVCRRRYVNRSGRRPHDPLRAR